MTEEQAQKVMEAFERASESLQRWARRTQALLIAAGYRTMARLWEEYAKTGCPYGVSEQGMWCWHMAQAAEKPWRELEDWQRRLRRAIEDDE